MSSKRAKKTQRSPVTQRGEGVASWVVRRRAAVTGGGVGLLLIILAVALALRLRSDSASMAADDSRKDVILITVDTLRWDALGYAGNTHVKTPFIDRLAREGLVFMNAHAHNVVTLPSHANILTGLYPYQHGVRDNAGFTLEPQFPTIGSLMRDRGYATGAFVGAFPLDARFGLNRGFDVYDDKYGEGSNPLEFIIAERPAEEVLQAATAWYESVKEQKRFLWIHLYDPHAPYKPSGTFAAEYAVTPYLGEVAATDSALARFVGPILKRNENLLLILTADHGEALGDHGEMTHGLFAYEATLKVPLIVHQPGKIRPRRDSRPARHIDIVPTILDFAGTDATPAMKGHSLLADGEQGDSYFEALSPMLTRGWAPLIGMIHQGQKYIDLPLPELYELKADPAEQRNLVEEQRRSVFAIRKMLADQAPRQAIAQRNISPEEGAKLLSLGYITGSAPAKEYTVADDPKNLVEVDSMMLQVVHLYQVGQLDRAIEVAREIVRLRPEMGVGAELLAFVLQQDESFDDAIRTLEKHVADGTASDTMKNRLGLMLSEMGRAEEAVKILGPLASTKDPDTLNAYGIALADVGKPAEALRQFETVLAIDPDNAVAYQNMGILALRTGETNRARQHLSRALSLNPELPLALTTLGVIQAREGNVRAAIGSWNKAISTDPRQYDAMFNLGLVATQAGLLDDARAAFEQFIRSAPPRRYQRELITARRLLEQIRGKAG